jgi:hypothetical protein
MGFKTTKASASGIIKVYDKETLWIHITEMGNNRFKYLLEKFKPGAVYHCDSLISDRKVIFSLVSKYLALRWKYPRQVVFSQL